MYLKLKSDLIVKKKKKKPRDNNVPQVKKWSHSKKKHLIIKMHLKLKSDLV